MANQLTINFTAASPAPSGGYLVRYWDTATPGTVLTTTVTSSPAVINNLSGYDYTGTIESVCSFGNSTRVNFTDSVCNVVFNISSTSPTNQQGTNGTATISNIVGGSGILNLCNSIFITPNSIASGQTSDVSLFNSIGGTIGKIRMATNLIISQGAIDCTSVTDSI